MLTKIWKPELYHGRQRRKVFFEGWYYKLISPDHTQRQAVIPGIFRHPDPGQSHAFIQVLDGMSSQVVYHRYPLEAFQASRSAFVIQIGNSYFHGKGFSLDISGPDQTIEGELHFEGIQPWPVRLFSPGVMGPYRFVPFMQTYHGILSLDHAINGQLMIDSVEVDFSGGRGYMEKDWGSTFPRAYIWIQSNHFPEKGVSFTASVATIPWLTGWFRGFLVGLLVDGNLYRFTTYLNSTIHSLSLNDHHVSWTLHGTTKSGPIRRFPSYQLQIQAERGGGGLLSSPELDGMTPRILESLTADIELVLQALDREGQVLETIYQGKGSCGGLEAAGSLEEIIDGSE
jgi:tocopherol cyclase